MPAMCSALDAPVVTSLFDADLTYTELDNIDVQPSILNRFAWLRRNHRWAFPIMAPAFAIRQPDALTTLIGSTGWAHFSRPKGRSVIYWYAPARWLYQAEAYVGNGTKGAIVHALSPLLRHWDKRAVNRADAHLAVSTAVAKRLKSIYGIEAKVLHPPLTFTGIPTRDSTTVTDPEPGYLLAVSRFLPYKNLDVLIEAMRLLPQHTLVIVGSGPEAERLRTMAGDNVRFTGYVDDDELAQLYQDCLCHVSAAHEDFGLTPLEAALFGRPTLAWRGGGFLDTIVDGTTGILVDSPTPIDVAAGVSRLEQQEWDPATLKEHAETFRTPVFAEKLRSLLEGPGERISVSGTAFASSTQRTP